MIPAFYPRFFFFNDTATTEIYTLSLHDALPISASAVYILPPHWVSRISVGTRTCTIARNTSPITRRHQGRSTIDRKSTRLNSSHGYISYAVFCLKKKSERCRDSVSRG